MPAGRDRPKTTALHELLRRQPACCLTDVVALVEITSASDAAAQDAMVNAAAADEITPLMLAAMGGKKERAGQVPVYSQIAHFLLGAGAARTVGAHSRKRQTAASYARAHGKPSLAAELEELAAQQLLACADSSSVIRWQRPGEAFSRCRICGDRWESLREPCATES
jgi:hypothetical protein